jgi:integrase
VYRQEIPEKRAGHRQRDQSRTQSEAGGNSVPLTAEEFRALFTALPERERLLGMICATAKMRIGEVLGLKWEDINFPDKNGDLTNQVLEVDIHKNGETVLRRHELPNDYR